MIKHYHGAFCHLYIYKKYKAENPMVHFVIYTCTRNIMLKTSKRLQMNTREAHERKKGGEKGSIFIILIISMRHIPKVTTLFPDLEIIPILVFSYPKKRHEVFLWMHMISCRSRVYELPPLTWKLFFLVHFLLTNSVNYSYMYHTSNCCRNYHYC